MDLSGRMEIKTSVYTAILNPRAGNLTHLHCAADPATVNLVNVDPSPASMSGRECLTLGIVLRRLLRQSGWATRPACVERPGCRYCGRSDFYFRRTGFDGTGCSRRDAGG